MGTLSLSPGIGAPRTSSDALPLWRLNLMRGLYGLIGLGMGSIIWPQIVDHPLTAHGAGPSMLGALTLLCLLGVRYPVRMLPLLLFELVWKTIWLLSVAWPVWRAGQMDAAMRDDTFAVLWVVIVPFAIPWGYVVAHYLRAQSERWR